MLSENTVFRRLPANLNRVELRFLDGIRFGIETADLSFGRLHNLLLEVTQLAASRSDIPERVYPAAIADAWATVDSMHRLKELLKRTPGLKQGTPEVALFVRAADELNGLRNSFHHAREEINQLPPRETAIWGVINWCAPAGDHITMLGLVPGTVTEGNYPALNPLGQIVLPPLDLVTIKAFARTAQLSDLHRKMARLTAHLESKVADRIAGMGGSGCDMLLCLDVHPEPPAVGGS